MADTKRMLDEVAAVIRSYGTDIGYVVVVDADHGGTTVGTNLTLAEWKHWLSRLQVEDPETSTISTVGQS